MNTQTLLLGAFYGVLGVMGLYNGLLFFRLKEYTYLAYVGFIGVGLVFFLMQDKVAFVQYAGEDLMTGFSGVVLVCLFVCMVLFTKLFLNTHKFLPVWDKRLVLFLKAGGFIALLMLIAPHISNLPFRVWVFVACILIFATGFAAWKAKVLAAQSFLLACSLLVFSAFPPLAAPILTNDPGKLLLLERVPRLGIVAFLVLLAFGLADRIQVIIEETSVAADIVRSQSQQLSSGAIQMSAGASRQAASTEEVSSSMQEMAANIRQNSDNAKQTEKIATQASNDAEKSGSAVMETVRAMQTIAQKIIMIEDIAQQTRLLSLNATIEAAKAGEAGKGFTVVASEVRNLANESREVAREMNELVTTSLTVAEDAGTMLTQLVPNIQRTAYLVQEISAASQEQTVGVQQINMAIQQLDQVTQQNSSLAEELAAAAEALATQAASMQESLTTSGLGVHQHQPSQKLPPPPGPPEAPVQKSDRSDVTNLTIAQQDEHDKDFERY